MSHKHKKQNTSLVSFVIFVMFILSVVMFFGEDQKGVQSQQLSSVDKEQSVEKRQQKILDRINVHVKDAHVGSQLNRVKIENENLEMDTGNIYGNSDRPQNSPVMGYGVNMKTKDAFKDYEQDLRRLEKRTHLAQDSIYAAAAMDQYLEDYAEKEKQAYAQAFIENARRDGFEVQLNDDLEVVKVKRIKGRRSDNPY